jgi:hypothetical protein
MRFFKYLVLIFASIISLNAFAAWEVTDNLRLNNKPELFSPSVFNSPSEACSSYDSFARKQYADFPNFNYNQNLTQTNSTEYSCQIGDVTSSRIIFVNKAVCPAKGTLKLFYYPSGSTSVPTRVCQDGCTYEGGHAIDTPNHVAITMQATGDGENCTNQSGPKQPPTCDKTDPYGGCYVPPNDDCIRLKDGSIQCPNQQQPPIQQGCENGATYCKRPPQGCGPDYVSGSFNGEQICVKKGPNTPTDPKDPDDPNNPNNCTTAYCPKPDNNKDCPDGYYPTTYQGQKICVKDNPDPNQPNPNDPNNSGGDDGGGASEPTGGDGDGSSGGSVNLKPVVDAINALKAALLSAIEGVSKKLTSLIDGQKESNDHLKNIKDESVKSNEKLDKSNEHLDKIEDSTLASSEAIGESNKKLDGLKDAVEGSYKCKNESYNPSDKNSPKYRDCTEDDAPKDDSKIDIGSISIPEPQENYISWSAACPPDVSIPINLMGQSSSLVLSWSPWCELLSKIRWAIIACAYFAAAYIILGMR